jgi:hypothetical protein
MAGKLTKAQREFLEDLLVVRSATATELGYAGSTAVALRSRGLIFQSDPLTGYRITNAGRAALEAKED